MMMHNGQTTARLACKTSESSRFIAPVALPGNNAKSRGRSRIGSNTKVANDVFTSTEEMTRVSKKGKPGGLAIKGTGEGTASCNGEHSFTCSREGGSVESKVRR